VLDGRDYVGALAVKSYTDVMHCFTSCVYEHDNRDIIPRDYNHVDSVIHPLFKNRGAGAQRKRGLSRDYDQRQRRPIHLGANQLWFERCMYGVFAAARII
jgi:hypothetical protein